MKEDIMETFIDIFDFMLTTSRNSEILSTISVEHIFLRINFLKLEIKCMLYYIFQLSNIILYRIILYYIIFYCIAMYCIVLLYITLQISHYISLHHTQCSWTSDA